MSKMNWVKEHETKVSEERSKDYFNIVEGDNRFVLLTHCAPLAQVWDNAVKKYRPAEEGDTNISIKGLCWVYQEQMIKQAKLPYTVVKAIAALQDNPDWDFTDFPFPHVINVNAKGAGTKEVEYTTTPSPKMVTIPAEILSELAKKDSPESIVEKIKGKGDVVKTADAELDSYNVSDADSIPF